MKSRFLIDWRMKIESFWNEIQKQYEKEIYLIYIVFLNMNEHYTLLKINEKEKKIYYYNLMTSKNIVNNSMKISCMSKIILMS